MHTECSTAIKVIAISLLFVIQLQSDINAQAQSTNYIFHETVDAFPVGHQSTGQWLDLWPGSQWANGPERGRIEIDDQASFDGRGQSILIKYPKAKRQSDDSGAQWLIDIGEAQDDLYLSYWVRFAPDFDFVLGGKLPGFGGAISYADQTHNWSARLMWREEGKIQFYLHVPHANRYNPGDRFWWDTEGFEATLVPGRWHHIEIHIRMNSPGQFDGLMEGWLDGFKAATYEDFYFRDYTTKKTRVIGVFFSTFFGGNTKPWNSSHDGHAHFDEIIVSPNRIGFPNSISGNGADSFSAWKNIYFPSANRATTLDSNDQADPDKDGQPNLIEFATGHSPVHAQPPAFSISEDVGDEIHFRLRRSFIASDLNYIIESAPDMVNWEACLEIRGNSLIRQVPDVSIRSREIAPGEDVEVFEVAVPKKPSQLFYRLRVTKP